MVRKSYPTPKKSLSLITGQAINSSSYGTPNGGSARWPAWSQAAEQQQRTGRAAGVQAAPQKCANRDSKCWLALQAVQLFQH